MRRTGLAVCSFLIGALLILGAIVGNSSRALAAEQSKAVGVQGTVPGNPPTRGATITFPKNGQVFTNIPITVSGICPRGLLVKLFKNNIFGGSTQCTDGSFSIQADLFSGRNDLVARVYDELDQTGPDSNTVSVTFNDTRGFRANTITLTSVYAKRGANPGDTLTWPLLISGGSPPYAISVGWGDGKSPDLISQTLPGSFNIKHVYDTSGIYTIIVKAVDKDGNTAFLQLVGVGNGALTQNNTPKGPTVITKTIVLWWPAMIFILFILIAFWLGQRHMIYRLRRRNQTEQS